MKKGLLVIAVLWLLGGPMQHLSAQVPAAPAPPPAAGGIVGLVQMFASACQACKAKICACPLGQLITNAAKPINLFAGGLLCPPCCPPVNPNDLKKPSTSPEGACAVITQDELQAPSRRKAIQCLAYVDCHWWPEAEAALINGLRTDKNECVRLEAALVLGKGCCCTKNTIEALAVVVSGSKKDGNPSENSERVKAAAMMALQHCLVCYVEEIEPKRPEKPPKPATQPAAVKELNLDLQPIAYYVQLDGKPAAEVTANARQVIAEATRVQARREPASLPTGSRSLLQLWKSAQTNPADSSGTIPVAQWQGATALPASNSR
jgi:hypothetical protein